LSRRGPEKNVTAAAIQFESTTMKALDNAMAPIKVAGKRCAERIYPTIDR
jgi:hypothetical protein